MPKNTLISIAIVLTAVGMAGRANADLVISNKKTSSVTCSAGICNATAANAVLNVKDLTAMLVTTDVHVFAEGVATDITVADPFSWASSHQLTLGAYDSLNVKAAISITGTSGLTIITNIANTGGIFRLVGVGKISFWDTSSTLVINNTTYTLINNLPALIAAIAANPSGSYAFANDYTAAQDGSYPSSPIPTTFTGILEGLGNAISNLSVYYSTVDHVQIALFSELGSNGQLSDLNLTNVSMQTSGADLASLVILNEGTIAHSSASGAMSNNSDGGNWSAAGLVYDNEGAITRSHAAVNIGGNIEVAGGLVSLNKGTISLSDASGSVHSNSNSGGLVSANAGVILDSYARGDVTIASGGSAYAGGLVGSLSSGTIQRCFVTGNVSDGTGAAKKGLVDPRNQRRKSPWLNLGGLVGYASGTIEDTYATGSVTGTLTGQHGDSAGGLVGETYATTLLQSYSLGKVDLNTRKYLGGVIGYDIGYGSNDAVFWDLNTSGVSNRYRGAGNVLKDKGLKGYTDGSFRSKTISKLDPAVWAENPGINNGYPYLIANPPPPPK